MHLKHLIHFIQYNLLLEIILRDHYLLVHFCKYNYVLYFVTFILLYLKYIVHLLLEIVELIFEINDQPYIYDVSVSSLTMLQSLSPDSSLNVYKTLHIFGKTIIS